MAYVVRKPGSNITEAQIMDSIAKQVSFRICIETMIWHLLMDHDHMKWQKQ